MGEAGVPRPHNPGVAGPRLPGGGHDLAVLRLHHQELEHAHHLRPQGRLRQPHRAGKDCFQFQYFQWGKRIFPMVESSRCHNGPNGPLILINFFLLGPQALPPRGGERRLLVQLRRTPYLQPEVAGQKNFVNA